MVCIKFPQNLITLGNAEKYYMGSRDRRVANDLLLISYHINPNVRIRAYIEPRNGQHYLIRSILLSKSCTVA